MSGTMVAGLRAGWHAVGRAILGESLWLIKRTFQPSKLRRNRRVGFLGRLGTKVSCQVVAVRLSRVVCRVEEPLSHVVLPRGATRYRSPARRWCSSGWEREREHGRGNEKKNELVL